jgi:two-component system, LuxR family, response regulator FixJ
MNEHPIIYIVDDDEVSRTSVAALVRAMGMEVKAFASAEEFLEHYTADEPGCVVTDLRLDGLDGLELQEELLRRKRFIPLIVVTGFARTPMTVRAMRNGAVTILDKPYEEEELRQAIQLAVAEDAERREKRQRLERVHQRLDSLTASERHVLDQIVEGVPNKTIATRMDVSERTVENRRHEIFTKMEAHSVAELVRMVIEAEKCWRTTLQLPRTAQFR